MLLCSLDDPPYHPQYNHKAYAFTIGWSELRNSVSDKLHSGSDSGKKG